MTVRDDPAVLLSALKRGDRRALGRLLTIAESSPEGIGAIVDSLAAELERKSPRALRVAITGPGGAGKSTLIDGLARQLRKEGKRVAILATDPTSERTGGALLGDRIRFHPDGPDDGLFFRSVATRGAAGGFAHAGFDQLDLLEAFGFDWLLIEAVGAGQSEIEVAFAADLTLVVFPPQSGDAVQALKAGLTEAADIFCINKADLPGAEQTAATLRSVVELEAAGDLERAPPVVLVSALDGRGLDELPRQITQRAERLRGRGESERRRRARLQRRVRHLALREVERRLMDDEAMRGGPTSAPHHLAREVLGRLLR